jgi:hypothetical protein
VKARGKKSFVLRVGVIRYGGSMFVLMVVEDLLRKQPFSGRVIEYAFYITINLLIWPLAGYALGLYMWNFYEKKFSEGEDSRSPRNKC